jgi:THO complex subunit 1
MKNSIAEYLKQGFDGAFFYRMVETVLARDKNWVRWKTSNCPSIAKEAITPEIYVQAKAAASKATTNKRLRPNPMGSLDLKFLSATNDVSGFERLKNPSRYQLPSVKGFKKKIELDDLEIDMEQDSEKKNAFVEAKASKSWRALRIASTTKLVAFDNIESAEKIDAVFQDTVKINEIVNGNNETGDDETPKLPEDRRPIVISGPSGVGKGSLMKKLLAGHGKVFGTKASHTTRQPRAGERQGVDKIFVTREQFNVLRDGDHFLEYNEFNGEGYGTSRKVVEAITAKGKVVIMEVDYNVGLVNFRAIH